MQSNPETMIVNGHLVTAQDYLGLLAQVEALKHVIESAGAMLIKQEDALRGLGADEPNAEPAILACEDAKTKTPQHHLLEDKVQAWRAGYVTGAINWGGIGFADAVESAADEYAESIRQVK